MRCGFFCTRELVKRVINAIITSTSVQSKVLGIKGTNNFVLWILPLWKVIKKGCNMFVGLSVQDLMKLLFLHHQLWPIITQYVNLKKS